MALELQWGLEKTTADALNVLGGLVHAATSDNVQFGTVLACQRFGNTLAISPHAIRRVEETVVPTPPPAILHFLQLRVGYAPNDCVTQLGQNPPGLRFLALVCALVSSMGPFKSSMAIQGMVEESASDKSLVPTQRHVTDLVAVLEPRCHQAGYADELAFWQLLLASSGIPNPENTWMFPDTQGVKNVVDAFRQLHRVGSADIKGVVMRTTTCAAWAAAFTKWCLGYPALLLRSDGEPLIEQTSSNVSIILEEDGGPGYFEVTIYSSIAEPSNLVAGTENTCEPGMTRIETYGRRLLQILEMNHGGAKRALAQAAPYALLEVRRHLVVADSYIRNTLQVSDSSSWLPDPEEVKLLRHRLYPFPPDAAIGRMFSLLFGHPEPLKFRALDRGQVVADLHCVRLHLDDLRMICTCSECTLDIESYDTCRKSRFFDGLCRIVADVLVLSLFKNVEDLRVSGQALTTDLQEDSILKNAVMAIMAEGTYVSCAHEDILDAALLLAGHERTAPLWIISSYRGQAVWPSIYETNGVNKYGYLSLSWAPGPIRYKGEPYAIGSIGVPFGMDRWLASETVPDAVTQPRDLFPGFRVTWQVWLASISELSMAMVLEGADGTVYQTGGLTSYVFASLCSTLIMERCPHPPDASLDAPDPPRGFTTLTNSSVMPNTPQGSDGASPGGGLVRVIPVAEREDLRLFALSLSARRFSSSSASMWPHNVVMRKAACLSCCLRLCRDAGADILIL